MACVCNSYFREIISDDVVVASDEVRGPFGKRAARTETEVPQRTSHELVAERAELCPGPRDVPQNPTGEATVPPGLPDWAYNLHRSLGHHPCSDTSALSPTVLRRLVLLSAAANSGASTASEWVACLEGHFSAWRPSLAFRPLRAARLACPERCPEEARCWHIMSARSWRPRAPEKSGYARLHPGMLG